MFQAVAKEFGLGEDESDDDEDGNEPRLSGAAQQDVVKAAICSAQAAAESMAAGGGSVDMVSSDHKYSVASMVQPRKIFIDIHML